MADLKDSINKLVLRYRNKVNQLFLMGMGVLLGLRLLLFMMDAGFNAPPRVEPTATEITPTLKLDSPDYQRVLQLTRPLPDFPDSEFMVLGQYNMFDPKLVQQQAEIERRANEKFEEALISFRQGRLPEARTAVDEALGMQPSNARAKELRQQILKQLGIATTDATATTTGTAQPPAAGGATPAVAAPAGPAVAPPAAALPGGAAGAPAGAPGGAPGAPPLATLPGGAAR